jgi:hypothetical protein
VLPFLSPYADANFFWWRARQKPGRAVLAAVGLLTELAQIPRKTREVPSRPSEPGRLTFSFLGKCGGPAPVRQGNRRLTASSARSAGAMNAVRWKNLSPSWGRPSCAATSASRRKCGRITRPTSRHGSKSSNPTSAQFSRRQATRNEQLIFCMARGQRPPPCTFEILLLLLRGRR